MASLDDSSMNMLHELKYRSESSDVPLLSDYGMFVALLDADEHIVEEAMLDASPKQLLKLINTLEDQLNDLGGADKGERELCKRNLYLRRFAIIQLRKKLGVARENQYIEYDLLSDPVLAEQEELHFENVDI